MPSEGRRRQNRKRTQRKYEHNEEIREKYPPFQSSTNNTIIHLHYLTPISTINELINKAKQTTIYILDTESQVINGQSRGALIQIQLVHALDYSTILLTEIFYLPKKDSPLFEKIKELYSVIFNNGNKIVSWGPYTKEFKDFDNGLIEPGNHIEPINLQDKFQEWHNEQAKQKTHPLRERREIITGYDSIPGGGAEEQLKEAICDCGHKSHYDKQATWSLQDAVEWTMHLFLDKSETVNKWSCGLDLNLNTWRKRIFSKHEYNQIEEKTKRLSMLNYAINDCLAVAELYFNVYPLGENTSQYETPPPTTTTRTIYIYDDELSDITDDEIEISRLKPPGQTPPMPNNEQDQLIIQATEEELNELNAPDVQPLQQTQPQTTSTKLTKAETQRKKNIKLKDKQRHHPEFQKKITRPIYSRYDYRRIRAQLLDDDIHTSHQIKINWNKQEVTIGFKTTEQHERATRIMRANYFSKQQYGKRWTN